MHLNRELQDRQADTVGGAYTFETYYKMCEWFLRLSSDAKLAKEHKYFSPEEVVAFRLEFMLMHSTLARGDDTRGLTLPDIFKVEMPGLGKNTFCVVFITQEGKLLLYTVLCRLR